MHKFKLEIVTPDRVFFSGDVEGLILKLSTGESEILYHTLPMVALVESGLIELMQGGKRMEAVCSEGFIRVGDPVSVFVHSCKWPYEIDVDETNSEISRLNSKIKRAQSMKEYRTIKAQLTRQLANLKIKNMNI